MRRGVRVEDAPHQGFRGQDAEFRAGLAHRGEGRGEQAGVPDVVEARHPDVVRHAQPKLPQRGDELRGGHVVGADDGVRAGGFGLADDRADKGLVAGVAVRDRGGLPRDTPVDQRVAHASDPLLDGRGEP